MIRLVQRQLIIPRGDTGTFSIPAIAKSEMGDASIFTIFDPLKHKKIFEKEMQLSDGVLSIDFTHGDTVNLPVGQFVWDIKFYKNVRKVDGLFVDGDEIDSYYAAFKLPVCEIRQTGDALLSADDAPTSTIAPEQLNMILAAGRQIHDAQVAVAADAAEVTEMKDLTEQMKDTAIEAANTATAAATSADANASAAQQDAANAADSMAQALVAQAAAETAQSAAEASEANALLYKNAASASATAASQAAGTATTKAQEAAASATSAANSVIEMQAAVAAIPTRVGEFENDVGYLVENDLASVAMSGDYEDLENKPFIPTNISELNNDAGYLIASQNIATREEILAIINTYGQDEGGEEDMVVEMNYTELTYDGGTLPIFQSEIPASEIIEAYKSGKHIVFHFEPSEEIGSSEVAVSMIGYYDMYNTGEPTPDSPIELAEILGLGDHISVEIKTILNDIFIVGLDIASIDDTPVE